MHQYFGQYVCSIQISFISTKVLYRFFFPKTNFPLPKRGQFSHPIFGFLSFLLPLLPTISLEQSVFKSFLGSSFVTPAFAHVIRTDVCADFTAKSDCVLAISGTAKLSDVGVTASGAFRRALHGHALPSTFAAALVVTGSVKATKHFSSLSNFHPFQCGEKSEIPSTLRNKRTSGYYERDTEAIVTQSIVSFSAIKLSPPANVKDEVTPVPTASSYRAFGTTGTAVQVTNFDVGCNRPDDAISRVKQTNIPEIALCTISYGQVLYFVQFLRA